MTEKVLGKLSFFINSNIQDINKEVKNLKDETEKQGKQIKKNMSEIFDHARKYVQKSINAMQGSVASMFDSMKQNVSGVFSSSTFGAKGLMLALGPVTLAIGAITTLFSTVGGTARSFETAFTGVSKVVDGTAEEISTLRGQLLNLTKELPNSFENLSAIAESGARLGVPIAELGEFTRVVAGLEVATGVAAEQIATDFARISNITGLPLSQVSKLGSSLTALGNNFATSEGEIIAFSSRIAGVGNIVGITAQELFGIATAFTSVGLTAESGGSSVSTALLTINDAVVNGGKTLDVFAQIAGKSSKEFQKLFREDATSAFILFTEGLSRQGENAGRAIESVLGKSTELTRTFLSLAGSGDTLREAVDLANKSFDENVALQNEVNVRLQTSDSRLAILRNRWLILAASIGQSVNNVAVPALEFLTNFFFYTIPKSFFSTIRVLETLGAVFDTVVGSFPELGKTAFTAFGRILQQSFKGYLLIASQLAGVLGLDDLKSKIEGFSFTKIEIDDSGMKAFQQNYKKRLDAVNKDEEYFFAQSKSIQQDAVNSQKKAIQGNMQEEIDKLNDLLSSDSGSKSGSTGKSPATKAAEEEKKAAEDLEKLRFKEQENIEKLGKKREEDYKKRKEELVKLKDEEIKLRQEVADKTKNYAKKQFDEVNKEIDKSLGKIEDYNKKIGELQKEIGDINKGTAGSVADRVVEIQTTLKDAQAGKTDVSAEEQTKLQNELNLALANTNDQELKLAQTKATENPTERILREAEARKADILIQIQEQETLKQAEILKKEQLTAQKIAIETDYTTKFGEQVADREETEIQSIQRTELARMDSIKRMQAAYLDLQKAASWSGNVSAKENVGPQSLPGRATGGQIRPNLDYLVGEKGPEIFRAAAGGRMMNPVETQKTINNSVNLGGVNMQTYDSAGKLLADLEWYLSGIKFPTG